MQLKPYPKYKDSGVEWLGEVPEGWEVKRLKNIIKPLQSGGRESESEKIDEGIVSIGGEHIGWSGELLIDSPRFISREYYLQMNQGKIERNDVLLVKDGATIGKTAIISNDFNIEAAVNEHVFIIRASKNCTPKFLYYFIISKIGQEQIFLETRGSAQPGLNSGFINKVFLTIPNLPDQSAIANFLDQKITIIDSLIKKNKKLVELLKEKRQAVISNAVTKGLDPKAKMKDSGIEWIGEIPEGWEVKKLRFVCEINPVKSEYKGDKNIEVTFLPMEKVGEQGELIKDDTRVLADVYNGYTYFRDGDVIVAKITPCFENGKGSLVEGLVNGIGFGSTEFHVLRPSGTVLPEYLYFLTYSHPFRQMGEAMMTGAAGQKRVPEDFVKNFIIGIPSINEQKQIVSNLKSKLKKLEMAIQTILSQIAKLKEYRQALISNVVTGKIDVKEEQP